MEGKIQLEEKCISKRRILWVLFSTCFKIGLFTFGGGFAMLPLMEREFVDKQNWITKEKFFDTISITQSVPGAVAINLSIFLGHRKAGVIGAVCAVVGVALPSFIIITLIAIGFHQFSNYPVAVNAFRGIRPAVVALIIYAGYKLSKSINWSVSLVITFFIVLTMTRLLDLNPVYFIVGAIIIGLLNHLFSHKTRQGNCLENSSN